MPFCPNCGKELPQDAKYCPNCGTEVSTFFDRPPPTIEKREEDYVSNWWYLASFFFGLLGGIIAWVVNKDRDPKKARNMLIFGMVWTAILILLFIPIQFTPTPSPTPTPTPTPKRYRYSGADTCTSYLGGISCSSEPENTFSFKIPSHQFRITWKTFGKQRPDLPSECSWFLKDGVGYGIPSYSGCQTDGTKIVNMGAIAPDPYGVYTITIFAYNVEWEVTIEEVKG